MNYQFLDKVSSPSDIRQLNNNQIAILCDEVRDCIINTVSKNGGHLASNLGAVELTVALHRVFSSPKDAIIFDVGHQCYTHKLLTGRFDKFSTLRTEGGISGFMRPSESEHDPFITGHSSNSISAAYGIYKAKRIKGEEGTAIAVIGDGAMTGGMAYEALNNAGSGKNNFIIILNDNKMSISRNVGALARSFTKMRNKPRYHRFKSALSNFILTIPLIGKTLNKLIYIAKEALKSAVYKENIFSSLGFNYLGPVDGHNIAAMESVFEIAKTYSRPSLIHVITTKGKGYKYAEQKPNNYHGVSAFNIDIGANDSDKLCFSKIAGDTLCKLAEKDDKICAITAAMTSGTGLAEFAKKYHTRFFDVGIAEQHAVTFASALAKEELKPFFAVYSSFLQRSYDQIVHDSAIAGFPIRLLIDRAGIVGEDGETHQGIFDVSFLTSIPKINIFSPACYEELEYRIKYIANKDQISAVRYPRGCEEKYIPFDFKEDYSLIKGTSKNVILTYGRLYSEACKAKEIDETLNIIKLNKIYPINEKLIDLLMNFDNVSIFEETVKSGGIGEHLASYLLEKHFKGQYKIHAINNDFVPSGNVMDALKKYQLDSSAMRF